MAPLFYVEHFSNCSIAVFAEGFLVFFWPLTKYPLIFFKESDEVGLFFLFYPKNFFLFPLDRDSRYFFFSCSWPGVFCFYLVPWILVDIWLVYIYIYIYWLFHSIYCFLLFCFFHLFFFHRLESIKIVDRDKQS